MNHPNALPRDALMPPRPGWHGLALLLALLAHGALIALLALGLRWTAQAPEVDMTAEVWDISAQEGAPAAGKATPDTPAAAEPPKQTPQEPHQPVTQARPEEAVLAAATLRKMAEARHAEQETARKAEQEAEITLRRKREQERLELQQQQAQAAKTRAQQEKQAREKVLEQERQKAREAAAKAELAQAEQARKADARAANEAKAKADAAVRLAARNEQLARMAQLAGTAGEDNANAKGQQGAGNAARSGGKGLSDAYKRKIANAVRPHIRYSGDEEERLSADVEVRADSSGAIISRRLVRSSGDRIYDQAVLRALDATGRLPKDENGQAPTQFTAAFSWPG